MTTAIPLVVHPEGRTIRASVGESLLKAAQSSGIEITATCGGRGRCTSCRVKVIEGSIPPPTIMDALQLGDDLVRDGYRLSCQVRVTEPLSVMVAPPLDEQAFQILGAGRVQDLPRVELGSGVEKRLINVALPREEHHQTSDLEELLSVVGLQAEDVHPEILKDLPGALRGGAGQATVTTFGGHLLGVEKGDTTATKFGLAVDVGTTSVTTSLIELESGEEFGSVSSLNPQAVFGGDLMSRIAFAQFNPGNLKRLQTRIIALLNQQIAEVTRDAGVPAKWIYKVVVVGNTVMHHVLCGIDPSYVGLAPYAPVMRHPLNIPARELHLRVNPEARVCLLPIVAGFVGADAVGVALATRIYESAEVRIAVDIGTNGEVLLGSKTRLWACSAPAGPALEGAQVRHGMRAALGAIDKVTIDDDVRLHTIGEAPALGICGSGLIDAVAAMLDAGVIDWLGLIQVEERDHLPSKLRDRVVMRGEERQFILARTGEAGASREIALTQEDIRQVQLCKGAIASGVKMLQQIADVPDAEVAELMLAGGFGNYISIKSAVRIGLIPPLPLEKIRYVGNAASLGAQLCLVSESARARAETIARRIEHVSLAAHRDFQDLFVDGMNFPR